MTNNDVVRRIRYVFNFRDKKIVEIFALADTSITENQVINWLKAEEDEGYCTFSDRDMGIFLNGLITLKRGEREGGMPKPEKKINNNIVLRKLKIALDLKAEDILEILKLADFNLGKHELSAFFRKPDHKHFRSCKDQILRNFLQGLQLKFRP